MQLRIDVRRAAVAADVVERARCDDAFKRLERRERRARAWRKVAIRLHQVTPDGRFVFGGLAVAGESRAVDPLPGLSRELLRRARRRERGGRGAAYESSALCEKTPAAVVLFIHDPSYFARCLSKNWAISPKASRVSGAP